MTCCCKHRASTPKICCQNHVISVIWTLVGRNSGLKSPRTRSEAQWPGDAQRTSYAGLCWLVCTALEVPWTYVATDDEWMRANKADSWGLFTPSWFSGLEYGGHMPKMHCSMWTKTRTFWTLLSDKVKTLLSSTDDDAFFLWTVADVTSSHTTEICYVSDHRMCGFQRIWEISHCDNSEEISTLLLSYCI